MCEIQTSESNQQQSKRVRDNNLVILRCARYKRNNLINKNLQIREIKTKQSYPINLHEIQTEQSDQQQSKHARDKNVTISYSKDARDTKATISSTKLNNLQMREIKTLQRD